MNEKIWPYIKVRIMEDGDCLLWQGTMNNGNPTAYIKSWNQPTRSVVRLMWLKEYGEIPKEQLWSTCKNIRCVNPKHRFKKGRQPQKLRDKRRRDNKKRRTPGYRPGDSVGGWRIIKSPKDPLGIGDKLRIVLSVKKPTPRPSRRESSPEPLPGPPPECI